MTYGSCGLDDIPSFTSIAYRLSITFERKVDHSELLLDNLLASQKLAVQGLGYSDIIARSILQLPSTERNLKVIRIRPCFDTVHFSSNPALAPIMSQSSFVNDLLDTRANGILIHQILILMRRAQHLYHAPIIRPIRRYLDVQFARIFGTVKVPPGEIGFQRLSDDDRCKASGVAISSPGPNNLDTRGAVSIFSPQMANNANEIRYATNVACPHQERKRKDLHGKLRGIDLAQAARQQVYASIFSTGKAGKPGAVTSMATLNQTSNNIEERVIDGNTDADDLLAGSGNISPDDVGTEFADLEESKKTEEYRRSCWKEIFLISTSWIGSNKKQYHR
ncbi:hypothetical protein BDR06DRAFT_1007828 [Suillus hirtellus]|nr:hypothetical protein BDR06DRAFT_1007828 [Suillus hirtellus]